MAKKITALILCVLTLVSCFVVSASAVYVTMGNANTSVTSAKVTGYYKLVSASNSSSSAGTVKSTAQRFESLIWQNDIAYELDPGTYYTNASTSYRAHEVDWRLRLTSNGGCYASGSIIY